MNYVKFLMVASDVRLDVETEKYPSSVSLPFVAPRGRHCFASMFRAMSFGVALGRWAMCCAGPRHCFVLTSAAVLFDMTICCCHSGFLSKGSGSGMERLHCRVLRQVVGIVSFRCSEQCCLTGRSCGNAVWGVRWSSSCI